ncbi:UDP-N-acetylmuramoylalanine--D-glutamate ligase [Clostridium acetireducens DSM 10703]|uniref:UDP-N-acetylmuramoylalanine--D-glutamate ligase n=1 Tax=Clostridium acetireducens DSM 10703 TaxID=1121290 RepID=A0A1E8EZH0_9CLOT|nr:UDP-N-acetylmuramoyl-L-alanine--D-glutamate ligase [Clostridium acetireducens]OFI06553.1 UDP-N-acetylmuramoylalanine--D-glutamate ligase [Clostridium acetireducens DSM 10703]
MKKDFTVFKGFIKGKNVAVVGIGISNRPLIDFLLKLGAKVSAFDKKTEKQLGDTKGEFLNKGVKLYLGPNYLENLKGFDVIFKTPSMRIDSPELVKARDEGSYITSEMKEFIKYCPATVFGVTGSDGKTTTTTLIYNMLKEEGYKTWVGGNIGTPLFSQIENINKEDKVVLELSSFQLMTMDVSPEIALVTNLTPNHLDIHKDMEEYIEAKKNIFKYQGKKDLVVLNHDNEITNNMKKETNSNLIMFSIKEKIDNGAYFLNNKLYLLNKEICDKKDVKLKGMHNVENLLAAFCAVSKYVSIENMKRVATNFQGVEHRCEFIRKLNGVEYYNDSIASSPTRTLAGLNSFEKPVILIAGGYDKNIPFEPLAEKGYDKIKTLILIGKTKYKIKEAFDKVLKLKNHQIQIIICNTFEEAVYKSKEISKEGDIVTLSPACASFDLFTNFEVRGNKFKELVNSL